METKMKVLVIRGSTKIANSVFMKTMRKMGIDVSEYTEIDNTSEVTEEAVYKLSGIIKERGITHLFSIHLIFTAAIAAFDAGIKYICYIWDAPYVKVYSDLGRLDNCWYSTFDKLDCKRWQEAGLPHVLYQPLAVNADDFHKWNEKRIKNYGSGRYNHDVCFVGQLYETNLYDQNLHMIPPDMREYFESIFEEAAFKWDGENRIYGKTSQEIIDYIKQHNQEFQLGNISELDDLSFFEQVFLVRKIANIERTILLRTLAEEYDVTLYTTNVTDKSILGNVKIMPPVAAGEKAGTVYSGSKINLNMALKGIEGGTPQRVMEIMASGGFVMSGYCPETAELFEEDREIVMFKTPEELFEKVDYYLGHDKERREIAARGQEKVLTQYTLEKKFRQLFDWVNEKDAQMS